MEKQHLQKQQQQLPLMIENQQNESQEFHPKKKQRHGGITNSLENIFILIMKKLFSR